MMAVEHTVRESFFQTALAKLMRKSKSRLYLSALPIPLPEDIRRETIDDLVVSAALGLRQKAINGDPLVHALDEIAASAVRCANDRRATLRESELCATDAANG